MNTSIHYIGLINQIVFQVQRLYDVAVTPIILNECLCHNFLLDNSILKNCDPLLSKDCFTTRLLSEKILYVDNLYGSTDS